MPTNNTLLEDMLALGGSLLGNLVEARHEIKAQAKSRADGLARRLDLVSRKEFDAAFAMLSKARAMQDALDERLAVIEKHLKIAPAPAAKKTKKAKVNLPSVKKGNQRKKRA